MITSCCITCVQMCKCFKYLMNGRTDGRMDDLNWLQRCGDKTIVRTDEWKDGLSLSAWPRVG